MVKKRSKNLKQQQQQQQQQNNAKDRVHVGLMHVFKTINNNLETHQNRIQFFLNFGTKTICYKHPSLKKTKKLIIFFIILCYDNFDLAANHS